VKKLVSENFKLNSEWHPTKNKDLKPEDFTLGSGKKIWWQCPLDNDHVWEAAIEKRDRGSGCPFCSGRKVNKSNNLLKLNPKLASEWHPERDIFSHQSLDCLCCDSNRVLPYLFISILASWRVISI
jgi:hypothetical protein